jgi:hypothetical protein
MSNQSMCQTEPKMQLTASEELLNLLLAEDDLYPWQPTRADAYFEDCDRAFAIDEALDETEIEARARGFFAQIQHCFEETEAVSVASALLEQFASAPQDWLEAIAERAKLLVTHDLNPVDRLVECVKPLLNQWSEDDLFVFARPVALAMRSYTPSETSPASLDEIEWESLSSIEKARYAMNVAQCAFEHLEIES